MRLVCPVLVGRERERALTLVGSLLNAAARGSGSVVSVAGETGVGKTRLANAIRALAERDGFATAAGGCLEPFATQPYAPVAELLRDLLRERDAADARALLESVEPWLVRLLPELGGSVEDAAAVEEHERYRVARGVCSLIERCAGERPLVIVLEDLHWSDAATLELLPWLARRVRDCAVLVLATLRSDELAARPDVLATVAELERQRLGERIVLAPLEPEAVEEMVTALVADASPALLDAVRRRSDGNPLFVEELVRSLRGGSDGVPPTIQEAIVRRVAQLPTEAQTLLSIASVAGERFELEPVRRIAGLDEAAALVAVRAALELELVREERSGGFRFRHALTRDAVYGRLLVLERRRLHGSVAETLAEQVGDRAAEVAFHFEAAGDAQRARRFAESAAERALALGALADARVHLRTALRVTWGASGRARLLAQIGRIEHELGDMPAAVAARREAGALYGEAGDLPARARTLMDLSVSMLLSSDRAGAMQVRRSVLELLEPLGESTELASAYRVLGGQCMLESALEEAARWSRRAIDLGRRLGADDVVRDATNDLGVAICMAGDIESGLDLLRSVLPDTRAYVNYGSCLANACRYQEAIAVSREGESACLRSGHELRRRICQLNLAGCLRLTGAWEEAESVLVEILAAGEETGFRKHQLIALMELAPLRADQGRWGEALALCERLEPPARDREELQSLVPLHMTAARALAARGDQAGAVARLETLHAHWRERTDDAVLIAPALALGCELGAPWEDELAEVSERSISPETGVLLQQVRGDHAGAAAAWGRLGRPFDRARALRQARGVARLEEARAIFAGLGAAHELALTEGELRQAGVRIARGPRSSTQKAPGGLTARELEVARLLGDGLTNAAIARELVISERTAAHHVGSILSKLGLASRAQVGGWLLEHAR
jgi:DNA-binding CsgD family transcriptional regulator/tetratricopeptide (TPR) repeat protein